MKTRVNKIHPHIGGGNPVVSSMKRIYFNDILGTTIGAKKDSRYYPAAITAFGETLEAGDPHFQAHSRNSCTFFTGKPQVEGLGYTFLFRNYRATLAKWQTADPLGYPDGWNQLAYCRNEAICSVDLIGGATVTRNVFTGGCPSSDDYGGETSCNILISGINSATYSISVEVNNLILFNNAANKPTVSWFNSSPDWILVHDNSYNGKWKWIKE